MNDDSEVIVLLFTQFISGQISADQFATSLAKEREKETQKMADLQNQIVEYKHLIVDYLKIIGEKNKELDDLSARLVSMTMIKNKWEENYNNIVNQPTVTKTSWWPFKRHSEK